MKNSSNNSNYTDDLSYLLVVNNTISNLSLEDYYTCNYSNDLMFNTSIGFIIAVPEWEAITTIAVLSTVILSTIFGNVLVILGVFTYKPLRIVQNFFIVSLAAADLAVAVLVMPLNVAYSTLGRWLWGKNLCKMWLTCDIMSCTSSILNLCAIALDRYWAITDPINYAHKRTLKRVIVQIAGVWILSLIISSPPLLGWNDWPDKFSPETPCQLTSEPGYVIYSSLGSFFIPLIIMAIVYVKIFLAARQRLRKRTLGTRMQKSSAKINEHQDNSLENKEDIDNDSDSGEAMKRHKKTLMDMKRNFFVPLLLFHDPLARHRMEIMALQTNDSSGPCENYTTKVIGSFKKLSQKRRKQEKTLLTGLSNSGDIATHLSERLIVLQKLEELQGTVENTHILLAAT
ncbi:unnamed protein product [Diatraea saccharalis]|uniref:G-protein coupled receptors family 1 profile domain-containing protein n=1 Tax=Diatraea saccharalis TaxID=40085 RepID=A0A9N9R130_9NEOP|nr:unnamed protein product [Diatraea saccharalis]